MLNCVSCGRQNPARALYCGHCGGVLHQKQRDHGEKLEILTAHSTHPAPGPVHDAYRRCTAKARHFLLTLICLLAVPVGLLISGWSRQVAPDMEDLASPLAPMLGVSAMLYGCVLYSYMMAKTGQAGGGGRFGIHFFMGCIPLLIPAVWARLGGRSRIRPYLYLAIDAAVLAGGFTLLKEYPALCLLLVFCVLPFMIYHLMGCSLTPLAHSMGLPPSMVMGWFCLGPNLLLGLLVWDFVSALNPLELQQSVALTMAQLKLFFHPAELLNTNFFAISVLVYLLVTFAAWVKVVYDNLLLPVD